MGNRIIIAFVIISGLFALSSSRAENELTLEAAIGVASEEKPFTSDWSGSVGPGGLLAREFAFKATYHENQYLYSLSFGFFDDYDEARTWLFSPLDLGGPPVSIRKVNYIRPTVKLSVDFIKLEMGVVFFRSDIDSFDYVFNESIFPNDRKSRPVFEFGFGEDNLHLYIGFLNSFPVASTGVFEMGIIGRNKGIYDHKVFMAGTDYQEIAVGYRGEFRIYKKIAVTPGFSLGGKHGDNVYMMTIGIKSLLDL